MASFFKSYAGAFASSATMPGGGGNSLVFACPADQTAIAMTTGSSLGTGRVYNASFPNAQGTIILRPGDSLYATGGGSEVVSFLIMGYYIGTV